MDILGSPYQAAILTDKLGSQELRAVQARQLHPLRDALADVGVGW